MFSGWLSWKFDSTIMVTTGAVQYFDLYQFAIPVCLYDTLFLHRGNGVATRQPDQSFFRLFITLCLKDAPFGSGPFYAHK
jgi:hypothetical protein